MHTETIIETVGGMSRFQLILMPLLNGPGILLAWGMLMMSFAGTSPDWWCVPVDAPAIGVETNVSYIYLNNVTLKNCPSFNNSCRFVFSQDIVTVISEWDLVCDMGRTHSFMTSIQMAGVMIGAFLGGQSADTIGRKPTLYLSLLLKAGFNLAAGFSVSWQMFTALRFFIGMMIGSLLVVNYPYFMEFIGQKWRPICSAVPFWTIGVAVMALSSWLRPNWSHQHIILSAAHVPFLLGWFIVPESLRWLTVKGRLDDAEKVVDQMSRYNRREKPGNTRALLKKVAEEEQRERELGRKYTYIDVYRGWSICWKSLIIQFSWICLAMVYYGIAFGIGTLSGSLFLNIFLLSIVELPSTISTFFLNNKIGRRYTGFLFFATAVAGSVGVIITTRVASGGNSGTVITVLALITQLGVAAAWCAVQVLSTETYPTVIRNLGYGAANTAARVGGITAPYIFAVEGNNVMIPFIIVGSAMAVCGILVLLLRETKGTALEDTVGCRSIYTMAQEHVGATDILQTKM